MIGKKVIFITYEFINLNDLTREDLCLLWDLDIVVIITLVLGIETVTVFVVVKVVYLCVLEINNLIVIIVFYVIRNEALRPIEVPTGSLNDYFFCSLWFMYLPSATDPFQ